MPAAGQGDATAALRHPGIGDALQQLVPDGASDVVVTRSVLASVPDNEARAVGRPFHPVREAGGRAVQRRAGEAFTKG